MKNSHQVIIFNGPPSSGKDEACQFLLDEFSNTHHKMFKEHLFNCVMIIFNISRERFMELYDNRKTKDLPTKELKGFSPRSSMIYVSEDVIKPKFGKDYFGNVTAENLEDGLNVFSDGGFKEELLPVYNKCNGDMVIVQLHREGCNFDNDSRSYIESFKDVTVLKLYNNGTLEEFKQKVIEVKKSFME